MTARDDIRNVCVIAHVDHGKTTLVDFLLRQAHVFREGQAVRERVMDSNELERERGITIFSKNCALQWGKTKINLIDTPGHADFGGEVERVIRMADGALLLVDASEGPMPQTRFVLRKALEQGLIPLVVLSKCDRPDARIEAVRDEVFDLLIDLGADERIIDAPVLYTSCRDGYAVRDLKEAKPDLGFREVFETILAHVPGPQVDPDGPLRMLVSAFDYDNYVGRIGIGRLESGRVRDGETVLLVKSRGPTDEERRAARGDPRMVEGRFALEVPVKQLQVFSGVARTAAKEVGAGDIACLVGIGEVDIGDSITSVEAPHPLPAVRIDEPVMAILFLANTSPFRGQEGEHVQGTKLRERLFREARANVGVRIEETDRPDAFRVSGRGVLQLGILIETMRREGHEFEVSTPEVILKKGEKGEVLEPIEVCTIDVPAQLSGRCIELLGERRGELHRVDQRGSLVRMEFHIPSRGLVGLRTRVLNATSGEAVMHHRYYDYGPYRGELPRRKVGVQVSSHEGLANSYGLDALQERGPLFVGPNERVYVGMIVGEYSKEDDITVNVTKEKHLSNMRTTSADKKLILTPPRRFSVEEAIEYILDDELVEITPKSIRMRKRILGKKDRVVAKRQAARADA